MYINLRIEHIVKNIVQNIYRPTLLWTVSYIYIKYKYTYTQIDKHSKNLYFNIVLQRKSLLKLHLSTFYYYSNLSQTFTLFQPTTWRWICYKIRVTFQYLSSSNQAESIYINAESRTRSRALYKSTTSWQTCQNALMP